MVEFVKYFILYRKYKIQIISKTQMTIIIIIIYTRYNCYIYYFEIICYVYFLHTVRDLVETKLVISYLVSSLFLSSDPRVRLQLTLLLHSRLTPSLPKSNDKVADLGPLLLNLLVLAYNTHTFIALSFKLFVFLLFFFFFFTQLPAFVIIRILSRIQTRFNEY